MNKEDIRRMLFVLGKEHCLDVMICLNKNGWQTASEVARDLDIHIATAVKYLSELHELGLLGRRVKKTKTRGAFEYKLENPRVIIELDLTELMDQKHGASSKPPVLFSILYAMILRSRKVLGHSVDAVVFEKQGNGEMGVVLDSLTFEDGLEYARNLFLENLNGMELSDKKYDEVVSTLTDLISTVIEYYESRLGPYSAESLVDLTMKEVINVLGGDVLENSDALGILPLDYFGKWRS